MRAEDMLSLVCLIAIVGAVGHCLFWAYWHKDDDE